MSNIVPIQQDRPLDAYRMSTDAAETCKGIVLATASTIQGRKFVSVEGWQAIAIAHGCAAGSRDVERVEGGVRAIGEVRRMSDGQIIATAEGFVGEDEETWFGGKNRWGKELPKRNDYAIRAMAQTRAISRACRSAFAHVVVMMNAGLATTPAEEVPHDGFDDPIPTNEPAAREKLAGPITSKTALKAAVVKVHNMIGKATSADALASIKDEHKKVINQALRDWPELINGDPNVPEDVGLKGAFERRLKEIEPTEDSLSLQLLLSALAECNSKQDLASLIDEHGKVAEELDGEESRRWEAAYNAREAALAEAEPLAAG